MAKLSAAVSSSPPPPPQNLMTIAKTMISSRPPPPPPTTTSKSNLMDRTKKLSSSILSSTSTTTTTTQLTPSPSLFRHFFYILNIYRYVLFCLLFGCMSLIIGVALFLLGILFRTNTTSIHLLESVPLYMPSLILFCNGLSLMAFMNKNTRRMYLLKSVCGLYLLVLLLMIIIAITTSAIHLPRFNSHRECAYNVRIRACACTVSSNLQQQQQQQSINQLQSINIQNIDSDNNDNNADDNDDNEDDDIDNDILLSNSFKASSKHFIMEEIMNCDIVHGIIYDSLRVVFALSLLAIIISLFSMITLFKLSTHEKRKLYFQNQLAIARNHHRHQYQSQIQSQSINYQRSLANYDQCPATSTTTAVTTKHQTSTNQFNHPSSSFPSTTNFKCLSADFSSQDLLIDNPNHHHQTFKSTTVSNTPANDYPDEMLLFSPNRKLERKDKIWSSSQSTINFQTISDNKQYRSSDINNNNHQQSTSNLRRYMSVILDTPSNVQSYVWRKLNSLKNIQKQDNSIHHDDDADDSTFSHHHHHHHRRKHPLLPPPHMAIPRFSVSQLSNMNANNSINSKSILKTSSSSSSSSTYSNESSSNLGSNSSFNKSQTIRYQLNTANNNVELLLLPNQQTNLIFSKNSSNDDIESGHQFETNVILFNNVEQSRTDFTSKYCQQSLQSVDNSIHSSNESTENHSKWSKYLNDFANSFECIDEDEELAKGFVQVPNAISIQPTTQPYISYFNPFESSTINQSSSKEQSTDIDHSTDNHNFGLMNGEEQNRQQNTQQQQQPSLVDVFTFASSIGNSTEYHQQIYTTFEEAFKNYYDSQNRISNNNYYTLPLKTNIHTNVNKDNYHRHRNQRHQRNCGQSNNQQQPKQQQQYSTTKNGLSNQTKQIAKQEPIVVNNHPESMEEIPFHVAIIEPPKDYQNLFPVNQQQQQELDNDNNNNNEKREQPTQTQPTTNQSIHNPYRYWLEQINQSKLNQILQNNNDGGSSMNNPVFIDDDDDGDDCCEDDDDNEDDDDDDDDDDDEADGAGDTSTSQDIADFELELDDEPIKFVSEEDFKILISNPSSLKKLEIFHRSINLDTKTAMNNVEQMMMINQNEDQNQNQNQNTIITRLPNNNHQIKKSSETMNNNNPNNEKLVVVEQSPITVDKSPVDLLEMNMNLLKRRVQEQMLNINQQNKKNDCGFDGFRKGCFDDDDGDDNSSDDTSTTTGTASSLSTCNGNDDGQVNQDALESTDEENSITAEFIKPPTPFTNYLFES